MAGPRRNRIARTVVAGLAVLALVACGADGAPVGDPAPGATLEAVGPPEQVTLDQPAIWPGPEVVFATPQEAAADFVSNVLLSEGTPTLGEFRASDARSGEIDVLFPGESGDLDPPAQRGLLIVRQIGPTDGWYVIAAVSDGATIDSPSALDRVPAGPLTVSGEARGFEGTIVVSAFEPGDATSEYDRGIGAGGAFDSLEPYSVDLDLSRARADQVVVVLVQGDTGLSVDPGTFAALPIVITSATPGTAAPTAPSTIPPTR